MKAPRFRSLTFRLTIWYVALLGVLIVLSLAFVYRRVREQSRQSLDAGVREIGRRTMDLWMRPNMPWSRVLAQVEDEFKAREPRLLIVRYDEHGSAPPEVMPGSAGAAAEAFLLPRAEYDRAAREETYFLTARLPKISPADMRIVLYSIPRNTVVQIGLSTAPMAASLRRLALLMAAGGALFLALASFGGAVIIRRALRPVTQVVRAARRISAEDLSLRLDAPRRKDEIGVLVETFNDMIGRLDGSVRKIRRFSGDVSHELRTPLTIIRGEIEVLLRKPRGAGEYQAVLESTLEETFHMEKIIDDLLFLSRVEAEDRTRLTGTVSLAEVAARVLETRGGAAEKKGVALEVRGGTPGRVRGEMSLLERLAANLIDNAIRYTPRGGRVEIGIAEAPPEVVLTVRDTGCGIPAEARPFIFDRFYVADPSRSKDSGGAGLGLSIVKSVADLHGARIEVFSEPGRGTEFKIAFPAPS